MSAPPPRGRERADATAVAFTWHQLAFEELLGLVQRAEALGYAAAYVDGDVSQLASLGDRDVLDGWTVLTALAQRTERIRLASIRLVHHWNAARLAQSIATFERIAPGRQRAFLAIGAHPADRAFGLPFPPAADRIAWLDETLAALRALWRGEVVTRRGRFVALEGARVRPALASPPPIELAAAGARMLGLVAEHADAWNINVIPLPERIAAADRAFEAACGKRGRAPAAVERVLQIFARPRVAPGGAALTEAFRRFHPWFAAVPDPEIPRAVLCGGDAAARAQLARMRAELRVDLPVVDLTGLSPAEAAEALDVFAPSSLRS
ncbi:MAG TPA: LLM class flavin-dependent oxidoreductase [Myxococcota bacterium]|nr:LLM class flavin-dependent oxidoreductase [Myxococcota bacterium]